MRPELIVFIACIVIAVIFNYALLVIASDADRRAEKAEKELEKEKKKHEHKD